MKNTIVGVTIGIGAPYREMAQLSSECFRAHTGISAVILEESDFVSSHLHHPAALKFRIFDMVNANTIVYFDCDWLCLNQWNPRDYANFRDLVACHDFVLKSEWPDQKYDGNSLYFKGSSGSREVQTIHGEPRGDYIDDVIEFAKLGSHYSKWINSGLFIASRDYHADLMRHAEVLYSGEVGHHSKYYEQPAMIRAIEDTGQSVHFLPRRYNVLATREACWPRATIGLHIKLKYHAEFLRSYITGDGRTASPNDIANYFLIGGFR